jgi:hypothetical protein
VKPKEPTPDELFKKLDELNIRYEVAESFEGLRVINFLVNEYGDEEDEDELA